MVKFTSFTQNLRGNVIPPLGAGFPSPKEAGTSSLWPYSSRERWVSSGGGAASGRAHHASSKVPGGIQKVPCITGPHERVGPSSRAGGRWETGHWIRGSLAKSFSWLLCCRRGRALCYHRDGGSVVPCRPPLPGTSVTFPMADAGGKSTPGQPRVMENSPSPRSHPSAGGAMGSHWHLLPTPT